MAKSLESLTVYLDASGAPWFHLGQVAELLRQPRTESVSRHIERGRRRKTTEKTGKYAKRIITLIDGTALIETCLALGQMPNIEARQFVQSLTDKKTA